MLAMYAGGIVFGLGLAISGMAVPEIVLSFLHLEDFGLLLVMGAALGTTLLTFQVVPKLLTKPLVCGERFDGHDGHPITRRSIVGAVIFGIGWGISGLCPATSITAIGMGNWSVAIGVLGMFLGALIYGLLRSRSA